MKPHETLSNLGHSTSLNRGASGNKKLHGWEFDRFTNPLEYKAEEHGILVDRVDEENTSRTCSCVGRFEMQTAWGVGWTSASRAKRR
jgi:transposase